MSLRIEDESFQPVELRDNTLMWIQPLKPTLYEYWLAWKVTVDHSIDPIDRVEPMEKIDTKSPFRGKVHIFFILFNIYIQSSGYDKPIKYLFPVPFPYYCSNYYCT